MFGRRADGVRVKDLPIIDKAMPYFMPQRIDAVNLYEEKVDVSAIDKFILEEKKRSGIHYTYTEILIAACLRMLYERPKTNRFIHNCMVFQRKYYSISISVKKKLTDDGEEITLKMFFTGRETLKEIKDIFQAELAKNSLSSEEDHKTTKFAKILGKFPNWMYKAALSLLRFCDKHGMLPRKVLDFSPFHTSMFITDLRSIKLGSLYHHLYNFGNTTIFTAMGRMFYTPVANRDGDISVQKQMSLKFSLDERVCDGLYYANSVKVMLKHFTNPELLLEGLPEPQLTGKELKKKLKLDKKIQKKKEKEEKKKNKKA